MRIKKHKKFLKDLRDIKLSDKFINDYIKKTRKRCVLKI